MSFEGYDQYLCVHGHLSCSDVYDSPEKCHCGKQFVWRHTVDQTNCEDGLYPDTTPFPLVELPRAFETCSHCGNVKYLEEPRYKVPTPEEMAAWVRDFPFVED